MITRKLIFVLLLPLLSISCEDVIDVNIASKDKTILVVEGWLTNRRDTQYVKLYSAKGISDSGNYQPVEGAEMVLKDDDEHREVLKEVNPGIYAISSIHALNGRTYTLSINTILGSYEAVSSVSRLGFIPDTLAFQPEVQSAPGGEVGFEPLLSGQELEGPGDYIQIRLYKNGNFLNGTDDLNLYSDKYSDGYYISNLTLHVEKPFVAGDLVRAEVWSLSEPAYFFWSDIQDQLQNARIFASPLTNPRSNIRKVSSGAADVTGFFGTSIIKSVQSRVK